MKLTVFIERDKSSTKIDFSGTTLKELLHQLRINPETIIAVRDGEVIIDDEILHPKDTLKLLSVISGG